MTPPKKIFWEGAFRSWPQRRVPPGYRGWREDKYERAGNVVMTILGVAAALAVVWILYTVAGVMQP